MKYNQLTLHQKRKLAYALLHDTQKDSIFKPLQFMFGDKKIKMRSRHKKEFKTNKELKKAVKIWCWKYNNYWEKKISKLWVLFIHVQQNLERIKHQYKIEESEMDEESDESEDDDNTNYFNLYKINLHLNWDDISELIKQYEQYEDASYHDLEDAKENFNHNRYKWNKFLQDKGITQEQAFNMLGKQRREYIFSMEERKQKIQETYGHISDWDVSRITNMENLFAYMHLFNEDISRWDVSNVTNMSSMFRYCEIFDKPLNQWNVSKVTNMSEMFIDAKHFNQPLHRWDTSKVKNMSYMFAYCYRFNQNLNTHQEMKSKSPRLISALQRDVFSKFKGLYNLNQDVQDAIGTFYTAWDVSNVTTMEGMFMQCIDFEGPIDKWNTSKVVNMNRMFSSAHSFNSPINTNDVKDEKGNLLYTAWDVSNVQDTDRMFAHTRLFNQNLNNWNLQNITEMRIEDMFWGANQDFDRENIQNWM